MTLSKVLKDKFTSFQWQLINSRSHSSRSMPRLHIKLYNKVIPLRTNATGAFATGAGSGQDLKLHLVWGACADSKINSEDTTDLS